ncbi:hypothetical protein HDU86_000858 [Geranomyces michiganensis]|nr:hypothetical protein HDU86_000858 [Geranomyces michiganensis]
MDAELREVAQLRQRRLQEHNSNKEQQGAASNARASAASLSSGSTTGVFALLPNWLTPYDLVAVVVVSLAWDFGYIGKDLMRLLLALCGLKVFIAYRRRFNTTIMPDGTVRPGSTRPAGSSSSSSSSNSGGGGGFADFRSVAGGSGATVNMGGCSGGACGR